MARDPFASGPAGDDREADVKPRKTPRQERARFTVAAILEATSRILAEEGLAAATTTRIAERAGVSIGSLYQYFPNRTALVAALVERYLDERLGLIDAAFDGIASLPVAVGLPRIVDAIFDANRVNQLLNRILVEQIGALYGMDPVRRIEDHLAARLQVYLEAAPDGTLAVDDLGAAAFVLARIGRALAQAAMLEAERMDEQRVRRALVQLGLRYLFARP